MPRVAWTSEADAFLPETGENESVAETSLLTHPWMEVSASSSLRNDWQPDEMPWGMRADCYVSIHSPCMQCFDQHYAVLMFQACAAKHPWTPRNASSRWSTAGHRNGGKRS